MESENFCNGFFIMYLPWQLHPWPQVAADGSRLHAQMLHE